LNLSSNGMQWCENQQTMYPWCLKPAQLLEHFCRRYNPLTNPTVSQSMSFGKISQGSISSNRNSPQTRRAQHDAKRPQITAANTLADRKDNNTHDDKHARQLELLEHKRLEPDRQPGGNLYSRLQCTHCNHTSGSNTGSSLPDGPTSKLYRHATRALRMTPSKAAYAYDNQHSWCPSFARPP